MSSNLENSTSFIKYLSTDNRMHVLSEQIQPTGWLVGFVWLKRVSDCQLIYTTPVINYWVVFSTKIKVATIWKYFTKNKILQLVLPKFQHGPSKTWHSRQSFFCCGIFALSLSGFLSWVGLKIVSGKLKVGKWAKLSFQGWFI